MNDGRERRARDRRVAFDYGATHRDINELLQAERDDEKRTQLKADINRVFDELKLHRERFVDLSVLTERVDWLVWAMRGVFVAIGIEIAAGAVLAIFKR